MEAVRPLEVEQTDDVADEGDETQDVILCLIRRIIN
jgi:hypothetical protein